MFQVIRKQTRPSTNVNFFAQANNPHITDSFKEYWVQTYSLTDKCVYIDAQVSDDRLELTVTMIWDSRESIQQMLDDPRCIAELLEVKAAYLQENNIQEILVESTEV
jgi:hypothetical protein